MNRLLLPLLLVVSLTSAAQDQKRIWVDSIFKSLSTEQKIGQLLFVSIPSTADENTVRDLEKKIDNKQLGGIVFTSGKSESQKRLTEHLQRQARVPLLIMMDASNGTGKWLDEHVSLPVNHALGAIEHDSLLFAAGFMAGHDLRQLGVHINLGPRVDSYRGKGPAKDYFGVAGYEQSVVQFIRGMRSQGILVFPGQYTSKAINVLDIEKKINPVTEVVADDTDLRIWQSLSDDIQGVIAGTEKSAVSYLPKAGKKRPYSDQLLSAAFAGSVWKKSYGKISIADLRTVDTKPGNAELVSFLAGNEIIISREGTDAGYRAIRRTLKKRKEYIRILDASVRRNLELKYDAIQEQKKTHRALAPHDAEILLRDMTTSTFSVVKNDNNLIPVRTLENRKFHILLLGKTEHAQMLKASMLRYVPAKFIQLEDSARVVDLQASPEDLVFVIAAPAAGSTQVEANLEAVNKTGANVVLIDLGHDAFIKASALASSALTVYEDNAMVAELLPQAVFGALPTSGKHPLLTQKNRIRTPALQRLGYAFPEYSGVDAKVLSEIESIAREAIDMGATPGCHVLVARRGNVIYNKSFGHQTYEKFIPVTDSTIYDLASVTKVAATLQTTMFLHDRGLIDVYKKASYYLPELAASNKKDFTLKDILTHQAGLWPFLPFWAQTMKDSVHLPEFYSRQASRAYPYLVADGLYASTGIKDSLWNWIVNAKIREKPLRTPFDYRYSDMGFYILQHLGEKLLNQSLEDFVGQNLYEPLGAYTTGYLPLLRFPVTQIAPTENDKLFRKKLLTGTVHDQGAAMHGGTAGHAGLFSNANDLAKLGQMLLQEGYYGGYQYYKPETVRYFTRRQFQTSRRGLGWDKPIQGDWNSPTSLYASPATFGHTGFTGTCIWVDPEFDLVYIFLSNRVHPDMTNNKLLSSNIRSRIQDVIYRSIFEFCKKNDGLPSPAAAIKPASARLDN